MATQSGFTAAEVRAELNQRAENIKTNAARTMDKPAGVEGLECIHCHGPVGYDGNLEYSLCETCLHDD